MTNSTANNNTTAVQVALRIRPLTQQDKSQPRFSHSTDSDVLKAYENSVIIAPHQKSFQFDHVFDSSSTQEQVFNTVASNFVDRFVDGYNVTILAYGQTSSGKTYTMGTAIDNQSGANPEQEGIIPRAMLALFEKIQGTQKDVSPKAVLQKRPLQSTANSLAQHSGLRTPRKSFSTNLKLRPASMMPPPRRGSNPTPSTSTSEKSTRYTVLVSFIEIYNEELIDLLNPAPPNERTPVTIREDPKGHIIWTGLKEVTVSNADDVLKYLQMGTENRATGSTDMNAKSSRSHAIFSVTLKQEKWVSNSKKDPPIKPTPSVSHRNSTMNMKSSLGQTERPSKNEESDEQGEWMVVNSKFHFVDLAGSERLKRTAAEGDRRKEGININAGLLALGNVISALSDPSKKPTHIPYRDSKLTRLLQDSLGGNSTTLMIACVSSAEINVTETVNTIKYAYRARNIRNKAERNETEEWMTNDNADHLRQIISKLKAEVKSLKSHHRNTPSPLSTSTSASPTRIISFANHPHNALVSPSSSVTDTDHRPSTYPSSSATTNITIPESTTSCEYFESTHQSDNTLVVADLRRQIEELHNEVTVTRERNLLVESELKKQQKSLNSAEFEHLVEPVIKEYETSISKLESQLAIARAALSHSDQALTEQQTKIAEYEKLQASEIQALNELKDKLASALQREKTSEKYCLELEAQLEKSLGNEQRDQLILAELREKIIKFKEMDEHTEKYISDLEIRLSAAENSKSQLKEKWLLAHSNTDTPFDEKLIEAQLAESNSKCKDLEQQLQILKHGDTSNKKTTLSETPSNSKSVSEIIESLGEKQARLDLLESQLREVGLLNKELYDLRLAHSQEIQKMEEAISQLKEECKHYQSKLFVEQQHSRSLEKTIQELSETSESHPLKMENAQKEYQNLQEKMRKQECDSQTTLRQHVEELEKSKLDIGALQLVVEKQDAIIQGLESKLEEMDRLVNSLRIQLDKSNMSVERLQVDNVEKAKIAADMQQQLDTMLKDVCGMGMEKKQLENVMCLMEGTLKLQEEKSEESMNKLEEIKKQYAMREEEIEEKRRTLDLLFVEKQSLAQSLQHATYRVSQGDEMMKNLVGDLESTKAKLDEQVKKNESLEEELIQRDVELQHIQALKDRIYELEKEIEAQKKENVKRKEELDKLEITLKKQLAENEALSKTVVELEATLKTERALVSAQDSSSIISELEHKLMDLQKMKKKEDGLWKKQINQLKEELRLTREENQQKQPTIDFLEASLNEARKQLSKFSKCQKLKEEEENATKTLDEYQSKLEKLQMNEKQNLSVNSVSSDATQEELTQKILQLQDDNVQLVKLNGSLESQLVLQRSQFTLETKNLELELMKLTAANDRLEKEMEQTIPRNNSNHGCLTSHNRESVQFSSPPQTPRVSSPPPSASNSSNTVQYKLQRDVSISSIAKLSKSGSYRSVTNALSDNMAEDEAKRMSNNSSRSDVGSPRLSSSLRGSRTVIASNTLPPLTAPPSNPLPPVPTPLPPVPFASSSSPLFNTNSPNDPISPLIQPRSLVESAVSLHRQDSSVSTSFSEILNATDSSNFTPEQYDKLVESLQRKVDLAEEDVKAHQDVIIKLEEQLNLSELSVKEIRKQFDTLNREKQACDIEIQNLRAQITQIQSEQKSLSDGSTEDRKQLEQELEDVRKKKDAAEKARKILEDRIHVLMNRKSKFMCF